MFLFHPQGTAIGLKKSLGKRKIKLKLKEMYMYKHQVQSSSSDESDESSSCVPPSKPYSIGKFGFSCFTGKS